MIRATETGYELSATVRFQNGAPVEAERANTPAPYLRAFCATERHRRWLSASDAAQLRDLIAAYETIRSELKRSKTGRALSAFTQTPYLYDVRIRGLAVACVLEGIVNSGPGRPTAQFRTRVPLLAHELGISGVDPAWAKKAYSFRSALAHGGDVASPLKGGLGLEAEFDHMVARMEDIVRDALRQALRDPSRRAVLDDPQSKWPIPAAACLECRRSADPDAVAPLRCNRCGREV